MSFMALPRFRLSERQVLMMLMGATLFMMIGAFVWSFISTGKKVNFESNARIRWMRPPTAAVRLEAPYLIAEYFDPSDISLPNIHGFSRSAWQHLAPPVMEAFDPERMPSFLAPPSGLLLPVLLEQRQLGDLVQAGLEKSVAEPDAVREGGLEAPLPVTNSVIRIDGDLSKRLLVQPPRLPLAPPNTVPQVARVFIAVGLDGRVRYAVLDRSSGNEALDTESLQIVRQLRFDMLSAVDPLELTWGSVRFFWATAPAP